MKQEIEIPDGKEIAETEIPAEFTDAIGREYIRVYLKPKKKELWEILLNIRDKELVHPKAEKEVKKWFIERCEELVNKSYSPNLNIAQIKKAIEVEG